MDELLLPVLRSYAERSTQMRMDQFLTHKQRFAKIRSKRLQQAVAKITGVGVNPELFYAEVRHLPELPQHVDGTAAAGLDSMDSLKEPVPSSRVESFTQQQRSTSKSLEKSAGRSSGSGRRRATAGGRGVKKGASSAAATEGPDADDDMGSAESDLAFVRLMQATGG